MKIMPHTPTSILNRLKKLGSKKDREGMSRYGINTGTAYGVSVYKVREIAKEIGTNHTLAFELWKTNIHEARLLAGFIADPEQATGELLETWVSDFNSWDLCDQVCSNFFDRTKFAYAKAKAWTKRDEEFVKRAGFVLMAALSVHDKKADDRKFEAFLPTIYREARDERNFVKKAVNWALRQIGKRNEYLNKRAIETAYRIAELESKAARWIAKDALRELESDKIQKKIAGKK
jgi:3-methyladenine DNA glycosylase AlkD